MFLLRKPILALADSTAVRDTVSKAPVTRSVVDRFIPGETTADAVRAVVGLRAKGLQVTLDHLGEDTTDRATADATVTAYLELIEALKAAGQVSGAEVSVKLSAVGQALVATPDIPGGGNAYALSGARKIAWTSKTTPPSTRRWRCCSNCGTPTRTWASRSRRCCCAPRKTWPNWSVPGPGCGW
jgi:proline dehydrogenase